MKTDQFNPSQLELLFSEALQQITPQLQSLITGFQIEAVDIVKESDNPFLLYQVSDADGDRHEIILQVIQRPDGLKSNI